MKWAELHRPTRIPRPRLILSLSGSITSFTLRKGICRLVGRTIKKAGYVQRHRRLCGVHSHGAESAGRPCRVYCSFLHNSGLLETTILPHTPIMRPPEYNAVVLPDQKRLIFVILGLNNTEQNCLICLLEPTYPKSLP